MSEHNESFSTTSAFLAGAFLGAGIALLMAPQTGGQLRSALRDYAGKAKDELGGVWDNAVERGKDYMQSGQEAAESVGKTVENVIERGKEQVQEVFATVGTTAEKTAERAKEFGRGTVREAAESGKSALHEAGMTDHRR